LYHLFAALVVASLHGLEMPDGVQRADNLYVDVNIFKEENKKRLNMLEKLPDCCYGSASLLEQRRSVFEQNGIFPARTIDSFIKKLRSYGDQGLSERLYGKTDEIRTLVYKYLHHM
jgi:glutamine synthetase